MKGFIKGIIIGSVIVGIGIVLIIIAVSMNGGSFGFGSSNFEMQTYNANDENTSLVFDIDAGSIRTEYYDGERITVEYPYAENYQVSVTENDGTLTVTCPYTRRWFSLSCSATYNIPATVVKLPQGINYNIKTTIAAGSVELADGTLDTVNIEMNAGNVRLGTIVCNNISCKINAGTFKATELTTSTADMRINAGTLKLYSLICPASTVKVNAGTADITLKAVKSEYTIKAEVNAGTCRIDGEKAANQTGTTDKFVDVSVDAGTLKLYFTS